MLKRIYGLLFFIFNAIVLHATVIHGFVKNDEGALLPFTSITIKGTGSGVTTNNKAWYSFNVKPGKYILEVHHVGYQKLEKEILVAAEDVKLDFILVKQSYILDEVIIKSKGEDPAYKIIRNTIKKRNFYDAQVDSLSVDVYIKGLLQSKQIPKKVLGQKVETTPEDGLDSAGRGVIFLSESHTTVDLIYPNKSKIKVHSTRESGGGMGLSFPTFISFYKNNVNVFTELLNPRGFISPIADNALHFYRYKLLGTYQADGKQIKTILVTPKRKNEPTFEGKIEIINDEWKLYTVDLMLTKNNQLELVDTLYISQIQAPVNHNIWRIQNQTIKVDINQLGFKLDGSFINVYENYNLHPPFSKNHFDNIIMKYDTGYNKKDSNYWNVKRPIALEDFEVKDFIKKDSLRIRYDSIKQTKSYRDSINRKMNKVGFSDILMGGYSKNFASTKSGIKYQIAGLLKSISFNTVEGLAVNFNQKVEIDPKKAAINYVFESNARYGFSNHHLNIDGKFSIHPTIKSTLKNKTISIAGGSRVQQLNKANPISPLINTVYTLFLRENYMKLYENRYVNLFYQDKIMNKILVNTSIQYENRLPLANTIDYSFTHQNKSITPNHPTDLYYKPFHRHQAFVWNINLQFQPKQKTIQFPDRKVTLGSKKPIYTLSYTKGIKNILGSDVDFDKWEATMSHSKNFKLAGTLRYKLGAGGFLNAHAVGIPDMKHFNGNQTILNTNYLNSFQIAPYYRYSNTEKLYAYGHVEHHLNGLLTNKIPVLNKMKWNLVVGANSFYVDKNKYYAEAFAGLENIFKILRVDFITGYQPILKNTYGIRIGLGGILGSNIRFGSR